MLEYQILNMFYLAVGGVIEPLNMIFLRKGSSN